MYDGIPAYWSKAPVQRERSPNEAAYVFLAIMLVFLAVPTALLGWAILHGITAALF